MGSSGVQVLPTFGDLRQALHTRALDPAPPADADVFCTLPWLENLANHGLSAPAGAADCRLLLAGADGGPTTCLPLLATGRQWTGVSNYYSSLFAPLSWPAQHAANPATAANALQALCAQLRAPGLRPAVLTLSPMDKDDAVFAPLLQALRAAGYWADSFYCFGNWYLAVNGQSFADYEAALPSALRHSMARGQRKLARAGAWQLRIQHSEPDTLEQAIADFVQVYNRSWKEPEPLPDFMPQMARMAAAQGWLRLGVLSLDGQPIAAQLWLTKDGKANIYKLAYVQGCERYSAGSLLTRAMMEHAFTVDGVHEVDYLTGDDPYKRDWMSHRRERWGIVAFEPRSWQGLTQAGRHHLAKQIKHWRRA